MLMKDRIFMPPERPEFPNYVFTKNFLTISECERLIGECGEHPELKFAVIGNGSDGVSQENLAYRTVKVKHLWEDSFDWVYTKLHDEILKVNKIFEFDLSGIDENFQFLRYDSQPEGSVIPPGHYGWHQDYGGGPYSRRKISVVVNLSPPANYKGCSLEIMTHNAFTVSHTEPGTMITFPSYLPHHVTDITEGTRFALVTWISGPRFK
jgi:PKHD-type hydroxylase